MIMRHCVMPRVNNSKNKLHQKTFPRTTQHETLNRPLLRLQLKLKPIACRKIILSLLIKCQILCVDNLMRMTLISPLLCTFNIQIRIIINTAPAPPPAAQTQNPILPGLWTSTITQQQIQLIEKQEDNIDITQNHQLHDKIQSLPIINHFIS